MQLKGGMQQIDKLMRKNVVLKTRRPKATCFEMALPCVLFVLLAYVRFEYSKTVETLGPFYFDPVPVFPLSSRFLSEGNQTQSGAFPGADELQDLVCDPKVPSWIEDALVPILNFSFDHEKVADRIMDIDAAEVGDWVEESVKELQTFDITGFIEELNKTRREYLDSKARREVERIARRLDQELDLLREDLHAADSEARARARAKGWINDTCYLQGPLIDWNRTEVAEALEHMWDHLDEWGVRAWVYDNLSNFTLLDPLRKALNSTSMDLNISSKSVEDLLRDLQNLDSENTTHMVDQAIWWISHFLRVNGSTAELLGKSELGLEWDIVMEAPPTTKHFRTELGRSLYADHWRWQQEEPVDLPDWQPELEKYINETTDTSMLERIQDFLDELHGKNASEIEHKILPDWEKDWEQECLAINSSKVADVFVRTQEGCPFYRGVVKGSNRTNASKIVADLHEHLEEMNLTKLQETLEKWQHEIHDYNGEEMGKEVQDWIHDVQRDSQEREGETIVEKMAVELSHRVHREMQKTLWGESKCSETSGSRRLQEGEEWDEATTYLLDYIATRKVLIAPYKGEVKELWDLIIVEAVLSVATLDRRSTESMRFVRELLRCPLVRGVASRAVDYLLEDRVLTFDSEAELESFTRNSPDDVLVAFAFRSADADGDFPEGQLDVQYAIRLDSLLLPATDRIIARTRHAMFGAVTVSTYPYLDVGFTYFQEWVGRAVARLQAKRDEVTSGDGDTEVLRNAEAHARTEPLRQIAVSVEQFPAPQYKLDRFVYLIQFTLPFVMVLGWIYAISLLVKEMVYEKQERLREVMRIMGLRTWVYWSAWFGSAMVQMTALVIFITCCMSLGDVLQHSNTLLVFTYFELYSVTVVSLSMLISACFSRAKVAAACAGVIYYASYLPYSIYPRFEDTMSFGSRLLFCLSAPSGMGIGMGIIAKWELEEEGMQFSNLFVAPPVTTSGAPPIDNFSLGHVMVMFLVDAVVYQIAAWYIEKVWPGTLGLPQPWYFPVLPSYWCSRDPALEKMPEVTDSDVAEEAEKKQNAKLESWEAPHDGLVHSVHIHNLTKTFRSGKQALKGITLNMHEGTILGLLGHNGAGKSTTMSILTGLYPPTKGDVFVNGASVRRDSQGVRRQLGVCLQHNALYETLTVAEHFDLFCNLKGVPRSDVPQHVETLLQDTGLAPKRNAPAASLSGGMKRKLSIGNALAGGSKVIALDEPTAGVDAISRREIWQTLSNCKGQRTILLSTHFMDEADVLSDRIAIIAEGQITAIGSSMSLKRHYADAYMLTVVTTDHASPDMLLDLLRRTVPEATFAGSRGLELSYSLPAAARTKFADLFASMQDVHTQRAVGIQTYGLSAATMEEVFLQASSVHEEGLHGKVRNASQPAMPPSAPARATTPDGSEDPETPASGDKPKLQKRSTSGSDEASTGSPQDSSVKASDVGESQSNLPGMPSSSFLEERSTSSPGKSNNCVPVVPSLPADVEAGPVKEIMEKEDASPMLMGTALWLQQFFAQLTKRALSSRRDLRAWASQILLPASFVLLALLLARIREVQESEPAIELTTDMYLGLAKGSRTQLHEHIMPFIEPSHGVDALATQFGDALRASVGDDDKLVPLDLATIDNTSGLDAMTQYLMSTNTDLAYESYGAFDIGSASQCNCDSDSGWTAMTNVTLFFKNRAYHAIPNMVHRTNNARLKMLGYENAKVNVWSHPLPKSGDILEEEFSSNESIFTSFMVAITVILAMGFIPASFVVYLVHEKSTNGKHQQLLTGVSPVLYWLSTYIWDMINFTIAAIVCFLLFVAFQVDAYGSDNAPAILLLLLTYGLCMTPFMYNWEPLFRVPATAYVTLICINIFTGTVSVLATTILDMYEGDLPDLRPWNTALKAIFPWMLPNYCLGRGLMNLATNYYIRYVYSEYGICASENESACTEGPFQWDVIGQFICTLIVMSGGWLGLRLLFEWRFFSRFFSSRNRATAAMLAPPVDCNDASVNREVERVNKAAVEDLKNHTDADRLLIKNLRNTFILSRGSCCRRRKEFVHSVRGVNVGIARGECFGLLGVNGAGKTTTMRMITGDLDPCIGDVWLGGWSITSNRDKARKHLGYCPQFDALPDKLTAREVLSFYSRIRGVPRKDIKPTVDTMIKRMCLEAHQNKLTEHLSGGNKRKLSTALAILGSPDVVLLDEPSTGIDVGARRFLWEVLGDIRLAGHALVLTSHSMDECEVLCTHLTIMVAGGMRCLGSPLQLKDAYGGGYTLAIKAQNTADASKLEAADRIRDFMAGDLSKATLAEENVGLFRYRLGGGDRVSDAQADVPLSEVFRTLEGAMAKDGKLTGCVADYTLSQTSLEEVFLFFSKLADTIETQEVTAKSVGKVIEDVNETVQIEDSKLVNEEEATGIVDVEAQQDTSSSEMNAFSL